MKIWSSKRIPLVYGSLIAAALILYFFVIYLAGWVHIVELRLFNILILLAGVYFALIQYRRTHQGQIEYFNSFTTGMATSSIAAASFSLFLFLYLLIDKNLMQSIAEKEPLGLYLDPYIASFIVLLEGIFSGLFVTFLLSNFLATRDTVKQGESGEKIY